MRFHIHVDAAEMSRDFEEAATRDLGFSRDDFNPMPSKGPQAYPCNHLSKKLATVNEFHRAFDDVAQLAVSGVVGYIEGECVVRRSEVRPLIYAPSVPLPFSVGLKDLGPREFRETEIHISALASDVDDDVKSSLVTAGFFLAYKGNVDQRKLIFTIQGSVRTIRPVYVVLLQWLSTSGALGPCVIKEERIRRFWLSDPDVFRPPVVETILPVGICEKL